MSRNKYSFPITECPNCGGRTIVVPEQLREIDRLYLEKCREINEAKEWIPVSERLPEEGEYVLIWYGYFRYGNYDRMFQDYGLGYQYKNHWFGDISRTAKGKCIAWMPLPEPYQEDG